MSQGPTLSGGVSPTASEMLEHGPPLIFQIVENHVRFF